MSELNRRQKGIEKKFQSVQFEQDEVSTEIVSLKKRFETAEEDRKKFELEIKQLEADVEKRNIRLPEIKTNEEYQANLKEIEALKKKCLDREKESLRLIDRADEIKEQIKEKEGLRKESDGDLDLSAMEKERAGVSGKLEKLKKEHEKLFDSVDAGVQRIYNRIRVKRPDGPAISVIAESGYCGNCSMLLPPQIVITVLKGELKQICASCACILTHAGLADKP